MLIAALQRSRIAAINSQRNTRTQPHTAPGTPAPAWPRHYTHFYTKLTSDGTLTTHVRTPRTMDMIERDGQEKKNTHMSTAPHERRPGGYTHEYGHTPLKAGQ